MEDFIGILLCLLIMIPVVVVCTRELDKQPDTEPDDIFVDAVDCQNELYKQALKDLEKVQNENAELKKELESYKKDKFCKGGCSIYQFDKIDDLKNALSSIAQIADCIINHDDKPACVYESDCPFNGGSGFDNHCDMHCPFIMAKSIIDIANKELCHDV